MSPAEPVQFSSTQVLLLTYQSKEKCHSSLNLFSLASIRDTPFNCFLALFEKASANCDAMCVTIFLACFIAVTRRRCGSEWCVNLVLITSLKQKDHYFGIGNVSVRYEPKSSGLKLLFSPFKSTNVKTVKK